MIKLDGKDPSVIGFNRVNQLISNSKPMDFAEMITAKLNL